MKRAILFIMLAGASLVLNGNAFWGFGAEVLPVVKFDFLPFSLVLGGMLFVVIGCGFDFGKSFASTQISYHWKHKERASSFLWLIGYFIALGISIVVTQSAFDGFSKVALYNTPQHKAKQLEIDIEKDQIKQLQAKQQRSVDAFNRGEIDAPTLQTNRITKLTEKLKPLQAEFEALPKNDSTFAKYGSEAGWVIGIALEYFIFLLGFTSTKRINIEVLSNIATNEAQTTTKEDIKTDTTKSTTSQLQQGTSDSLASKKKQLRPHELLALLTANGDTELSYKNIENKYAVSAPLVSATKKLMKERSEPELTLVTA